MSEPTVSVSLTVKEGNKALDFYTRALGAEVTYTMPSPDGGVAHAEFMLGTSKIYLSDESEEWHAYAMPEGGRASCLFSLSTDDCDVAFKKAVDAGGTVLTEPTDTPWGCRCAMIQDPFGYRWSLLQVIEVLTHEQIEERMKQSAEA